MDIVISKLSDKCERCKHVNNCNEKRMMFCKAAEHIAKNPPIAAPVTQPIIAPIIQLELRDTSTAAQIAEQLKKDFYKSLYACEFKG